MPIPTPEAGDTEQGFVSRCMATLASDHPDESQRSAICYAAWREHDAPRFTIKDRELFTAGTHNGEKYTVADLDAMVEAFNAMDWKPAIKQGHVADETGLPALGYVDNLRRVGKTLVGDFIDLPKEVFNSLVDRRFGRLSAEVFHNFRRSGKIFRRALKAVALLGVEIPAVAGLKALHAFSERSWDSIHNCDLGGSMELDKLEKQVADLSTELKSFRDENATLKQFADEKAEAADKASKENDALRAQLFARDLKEKVDAITIPALRSFFEPLYAVALKEPRLVKFADGEVSAATVLDKLADAINSKAAHLFAEAATNPERQDAKSWEKDPGAEVADRVTKYRADNKGATYSDAMKIVLANDPDLKAAYTKVPN